MIKKDHGEDSRGENAGGTFRGAKQIVANTTFNKKRSWRGFSWRKCWGTPTSSRAANNESIYPAVINKLIISRWRHKQKLVNDRNHK